MRLICISLLAFPGLAMADDRASTEPAVIVLLLLGLVALIAGLSSAGDLRRKHMMPPRPGKRLDDGRDTPSTTSNP